MITPVACFAASILCTTSAAFATDPIVWDNGDVYFEQDPIGIWVLSIGVQNGEGVDSAIADDFILEQDSLITGLQWSGLSNYASPGSLPDGFVIEFFRTDPSGTLPTGGKEDVSESAIASYLIPMSAVETSTDEMFWDPEQIMHFAADLPTAFAAEAGELYWVSIQAYFEGAGHYYTIFSDRQQLNVFATASDGTWSTYEFGEGVYEGDITFKLFGIPACRGDFVTSASLQPPGDGTVDAADLAYLLGEWGANPGSFADLVTSDTFQPPPDGIVDAADLAALLGAWGPCD